MVRAESLAHQGEAFPFQDLCRTDAQGGAFEVGRVAEDRQGMLRVVLPQSTGEAHGFCEERGGIFGPRLVTQPAQGRQRETKRVVRMDARSRQPYGLGRPRHRGAQRPRPPKAFGLLAKLPNLRDVQGPSARAP